LKQKPKKRLEEIKNIVTEFIKRQAAKIRKQRKRIATDEHGFTNIKKIFFRFNNNKKYCNEKGICTYPCESVANKNK